MPRKAIKEKIRCQWFTWLLGARKRDRVLVIHSALRPVLERLPKHPDGHVFRAACGGKLNPDKVRKAFDKYVLEPLSPRFPSPDDEPGFKDGVPHSFRHYFMSVCAHSNIPERVVRNWLGHNASRSITWYYHLAAQESKMQMAKVEIARGASTTWKDKVAAVTASYQENKQENSIAEVKDDVEKLQRSARKGERA